MWAGHTLTRSPTRAPSSGTKVTCSSEQNRTVPPSTVGSPWSMPSDLSPQSATAHLADTEMTVASTHSAGRKAGVMAANVVSIRAYEPAWISVAQVLRSHVTVAPAETTSPPTASAADSN